MWLEPGYDHGRFGAWMLDMPGCFTWRHSREEALRAAPPTAARFVRWLAGHGEAVQPDDEGPLAVVEEVPARVVDGYEIKATFAVDRHLVTADEFGRSLRWLAYAREDLLRVLLPWEDQASSAPSPSATEFPPTAGSVLRHVAGAEIWLAGRLDPSSRYQGALDGAPAHTMLSETRQWTIGCLAHLMEADPAMEAVDRKGELWTLAKVLRRLTYHSLDHLAEIEPLINSVIEEKARRDSVY